MLPLDDVRVLDFSTLLPGPLATLILREAGAEVTKVERPDRGDEMRAYQPALGEASVNFALLNRGKRSIEVDLKRRNDRDRVLALATDCDVLVEQFRPGVMRRLGLDYETLAELNPHIVYCSITGYGQTGPRAARAGHDLNYVAETGMLSLIEDAAGAPALPSALVADIGAGAYPAVMNILLALRHRERTGAGTHLDVSITDNVFPFLYWALGNAATGTWPTPGGELVTGGSPRYNLYRTADDRHLAVAPLEDRFWELFCELIELPEPLRHPDADPRKAIKGVAARVAAHPASHWKQHLANVDVCCSVVRDLEEALADDHVAARRLFDRTVGDATREVAALPLPIDSKLRDQRGHLPYPTLGDANPALP